MKFSFVLAVLLLNFCFSLEAFLIEKEIRTTSTYGETVKKVKLYISKGYEKEISEIRQRVSFHPQKFLPFLPQQPEGKVQEKIQKSESIRVFREGKILVYMINHDKKFYTKQSLPGRMLIVGYMILFDCSRGKCRINENNIKFTNEFRKVGKWKARKVIQRANFLGKSSETVSWLTKESKTLIDAERVRVKNIYIVIKNDPMVANYINDLMKLYEEYLNKYGVAVMIETPYEQGKTVEIIRSVKKVNVPSNFYKLPSGYKPYGNFIHERNY